MLLRYSIDALEMQHGVRIDTAESCSALVLHVPKPCHKLEAHSQAHQDEIVLCVLAWRTLSNLNKIKPQQDQTSSQNDPG